MRYEIDQREDITIFKLEESRLDASISADLKSQFVILMQAEGVENLILDLSPVEFCDSQGLSALLIARRQIEAKDGFLAIAGLTERVKQLMTISQLDRVFDIYPTVAAALDDLEVGDDTDVASIFGGGGGRSVGKTDEAESDIDSPYTSTAGMDDDSPRATRRHVADDDDDDDDAY